VTQGLDSQSFENERVDALEDGGAWISTFISHTCSRNLVQAAKLPLQCIEVLQQPALSAIEALQPTSEVNLSPTTIAPASSSTFSWPSIFLMPSALLLGAEGAAAAAGVHSPHGLGPLCLRAAGPTVASTTGFTEGWRTYGRVPG